MMEMMLDRATHSRMPAPTPAVACADGSRPANPEAAHLEAAAELLLRHGLQLADCHVSRLRVGFDEDADAVMYVVRVGAGADIFALNEALTAVQLARGLTPSAQLDVVFER